jgi:hypothetical protein
MSAIHDIDLSTFCGRIGNLYVRSGLSPPITLYDAARGWMARDIPLSHCIDVIEDYLSRHGRSCSSGSGDRNFAWLNSLIQTSWYEQQVSPPQARATPSMKQRMADRDWVDRQPSSDHEVDPRRTPIGQEAPVASRSDVLGRRTADQAAPHSVKSFDQKRTQPKRIDHAIAFLRRELAEGEVAATLLEEEAKARGVSPRTLDRARARLNVRSRRTGFAKSGKSWLSLPTAP